MLSLAIECSSTGGSLALAKGNGALLDSILVRPLSPEIGSVRTMASGIREILPVEERIELISLTVGPGSFTGLRVGVATAKMLAFAWKIPLAAVDTLDVIAERQRSLVAGQAAAEVPEGQTVLTVINAFRQQVFVAGWMFESACGWRRIATSQVVDVRSWTRDPLGSMASYPDFDAGRVTGGVVSGPGLELYPPELAAGWRLADPADWHPRAIDVAELGWRTHLSGETVSAAELLPNYVRASAAEEKAREREAEASHKLR